VRYEVVEREASPMGFDTSEFKPAFPSALRYLLYRLNYRGLHMSKDHVLPSIITYQRAERKD
jgi:hypothetical protein